MNFLFKKKPVVKPVEKAKPKELEEGEEVEMDFEDQVLDMLGNIMDELKAFNERLDTIEKTTDVRIDRLEFDLRGKNAYVENLLAKLLDKDYVMGSISKSSGSNGAASPSTSKYGSGSSGVSKEPAKLAGPVGKLPA